MRWSTIEEIWKGVIYQGIDYSWRFECSNLGRIRNAINKHINTPHKSGVGYFQICTTVNDKRKNIKVHKAVAESFIDNPNNLPVVNHKDGNKENNNVDNLEWVTHKENSRHAIDLGLLSYDSNNNSKYDEDGNYIYSGENNNLSKLTNEDVIYIREHYIPKGVGMKNNRQELADKFNVTPQLVYKIYKREIWKHIWSWSLGEDISAKDNNVRMIGVNSEWVIAYRNTWKERRLSSVFRQVKPYPVCSRWEALHDHLKKII